MAPWPEQGSEPKAPDKDDKREVLELVPKLESEDSPESVLSTRSEQLSKPEEKEVLTLDEGQLKALLDEAITYKNPKDREGKSELFKELLQEAEADESESKGLGSSLTGKLPRAYYNLPARRKHSRHQGRECCVGVSTTRGGSLQNLHALGMEGNRGGRSRRSGRSGDTLVSARQREGGSLPTNVNVDNEADLDSIICPNYTSRATLEVSSARREDFNGEEPTYQPHNTHQMHGLPNGTDHQSAPGYNPPRSGSHTKEESLKYASTICVGPVESGSLLYPPSPIQHVSVLSIPPPQIHVGPDPNSRMATFAKDSSETKTRSVDENGNALGCVRMDSNCLDRKKQRRVKTKNDQNFILAENIEGFRGAADIDTLMEYIESPSNVYEGNKSNKNRANQTNGPRNHVKVRAKDEDSRPIKRRTKEKFQRCNSLEEISKTKLEDLTEEVEKANGTGKHLTKKHVTVDDGNLGKKSSWNENNLEGNNAITKKHKDPKVDRASPEGIQESEFHVVTKKQRKKKRRAGCSGRVASKPVYYATRGFPAHDRTLERDGSSGLLYQYRHGRSDPTGSQPRRKSASSVPPSDKSDSSDLDSVHSLPVSSTTPRTKVGKNSVSGGSTPQASYADIARTVSSPPDIGSQGNISKQGKSPPYLSCVGPDYEISLSDPIPTVMLPAPLASTLVKKDAMTDTNCDTITPTLADKEYPPLEVKNADLFIEAKAKHARNAPRDNNMSEDKVSLKTVPSNFVIPVSESGDVPHVLSVDMPSSCVKLPLGTSNVKRPPVILMDEPMVSSQVPTDFTFGFEVNQQLLLSEDSPCNQNNILSSSSVASTPVSSLSSAPRDPNMERMIQYLSSAWDDTMKDLSAGRAVYYNSNEH